MNFSNMTKKLFRVEALAFLLLMLFALAMPFSASAEECPHETKVPATCLKPEYCAVCGTELGTVLNPENHAYGSFTQSGDRHTGTCSNPLCKDEAGNPLTITEDCFVGKDGIAATCMAPAVCGTCNNSFGAKSDEHALAEKPYPSETGSTHYQKCSVSGCEYVSTAVACSSEAEATCLAAKTCVCGRELAAQLEHNYSYSLSGNVFTESCDKGCNHNATATVAIDAGASLAYTGSAVTPVKVITSDNWQGEVPTISYENNVNISTESSKAKAVATLGDKSTEAIEFSIDEGIIVYEAKNYEEEYDGAEHSISLSAPEGAKISYGSTEGVYDLTEAPKYKAVGPDVTVYFKIEKEHFETVTGSARVSIAPRELHIELSESSFEFSGDVEKPELKITNIVSINNVSEDVSIKNVAFSDENSKAVGSYDVTVSELEGKDAGNYKLPAVTSLSYSIVDSLKPVISGITLDDEGKAGPFYASRELTVSDLNLYSVTLNGVSQTFTGTSCKVSLAGNVTEDRTYTVVADDNAGNSVTATISMKPFSALIESVKDVTEDNVKISDRVALEAAIKALQDELKLATVDAEKEELSKLITKLNAPLSVLDAAHSTSVLIAKLKLSTAVTPDDLASINAYAAARSSYDALSVHGKELITANEKAKLTNVGKALVAYKILDGDKDYWYKSSGKTLVFKINGYHGFFDGIKIDGSSVTTTNYTTAAGSTIVTIKSNYLGTLKNGTHDIEFFYDGIYSTGSVKGSFSVLAASGSAKTGDDSNIPLWSSLALASLVGCAAVFMSLKKKKYE